MNETGKATNYVTEWLGKALNETNQAFQKLLEI